ncbi:MAG: FkbM family methyltransferase [Novosphingobium sp.]
MTFAVDRVIYDFGMNNGDNLDYYLMKGVRVVGIDANSALCERVRERFSLAIDSGQLRVVNAALTTGNDGGSVDFYLHRESHVLSQLLRPAESERHSFEAVTVPCRTPASIVREHGHPIYIKVDVEHFDQQVLNNLFENGILPDEVSAESHSVDVFASLVNAGYTAFNLVEGASVPVVYANTMVDTPNGPVEFSFKPHTAGPFGQDLTTEWLNADSFLYHLAFARLGWKDIHASRSIPPTPGWTNRRIVVGQAASAADHVVKWLRRRTMGRS